MPDPLVKAFHRSCAATVDALVDHLETHVAPHLAPDVSSYAPGRTRAWLQIEAPLGPTQPWLPGLASARLWPWLVQVWQRRWPASEPDLGLAIRGDHGIAWHRDASYACPGAVIVNFGTCRFGIDGDRNSPNGDPRRPLHYRLDPGVAYSFDCKHQHRVIDADEDRWSIVLWRQKLFPPRPVAPVAIP